MFEHQPIGVRMPMMPLLRQPGQAADSGTLPALSLSLSLSARLD